MCSLDFFQVRSAFLHALLSMIMLGVIQGSFFLSGTRFKRRGARWSRVAFTFVLKNSTKLISLVGSSTGTLLLAAISDLKSADTWGVIKRFLTNWSGFCTILRISMVKSIQE